MTLLRNIAWSCALGIAFGALGCSTTSDGDGAGDDEARPGPSSAAGAPGAGLAPLPPVPATAPPRVRVVPPKAPIEQQPGRSADRVVVKFSEGTKIRLHGGKLVVDDTVLDATEATRMTRAHLAPPKLARELRAIDALVSPLEVARLFDRPEQELDDEKMLGEALGGEELADLNLYYTVRVRGAAEQKALVEALNAMDAVETAYAAPIPEDAAVDAAPATARYTTSQRYVEAAPEGIDARYARTVEGGAGFGVKIVDVEQGWNLAHEDLPPTFFGVGFPGAQGSINHGTAVLGIIAGVENGYGVTGLAADARIGVSSARIKEDGSEYSVAKAINAAAASLAKGDILLIEQHSPGPLGGLTCPTVPSPCNCGQFGYVAMEYFQAEYDAIKAATIKGIVVVEAAGNGQMDLDAARYGRKFDRTFRDSDAILVGAGDSLASKHQPLCFTNYGSRVDVHAWGQNVMSLGYGDVQANGADQNQWYTRTFSGTSSASPIVVGAVAALQGVRIAHGLAPSTSLVLRNLLKNTGTAQATPPAGTPLKAIGVFPDLKRALTTYDLSNSIKPTVSLVHTASAANSSGGATRLDHASFNGNPNVVLQVSHNWSGSPAQIVDDKVLGVAYDRVTRRWSVIHEDGSPVPVGASFNVVAHNGFVHRTTVENASLGWLTYVDHPVANGNPNAVLQVTANSNPGDGASTANNHPIGVLYDASTARWGIFNQDGVDLTVGAAFNVSVGEVRDAANWVQSSARHTVSTPEGHASTILHPLASGAGLHLLLTHSYSPYDVYDPTNAGLYFDGTRWAVYNQDFSTMLQNTTFNVTAANAPRPGW